MLEQYEEMRNNIRHFAIKEKDYIKVVELCFEYLKKISNLPEERTKHDKKWIYYEIALNSKKAGDYGTAIKYLLISMKYLDIADYEGSKYVNRLWLLASCHENLGNINEAKKLYYNCSNLYRKLSEENQRAIIIFNNAKLMRNFKAMHRVIEIYEKRNLKTVIKTYGDMEYDDILKSFYTELFELYILENRQDAFKLLYSVKSKTLRKELSLKLVA